MNHRHFTRTACITAMLALTALPAVAYAGEAERARTAIAEARGKIDAGDKVGLTAEAADIQGRARAALESAEMRLAKGRKGEAIADAQHASELADMAIVSADKHKVAAERNGRMEAQSSAAVASESAAAANARAEAAQQAAAAAQQSAATANAQADALRNVPPPPAPTTTTVSTVEKDVVQDPAPVTHTTAHRTTHRAVHKAVPVVAKTTTTVTTTQP